MINWDKLTRADSIYISKITNRVISMYPALSKLSVEMDITAAHLASPLDLDRFLEFEDLDFYHDICGIRENIDRRTGELKNCFLPRCAR